MTVKPNSAMERAEEVPHLRIGFRRRDEQGKLQMVAQFRDDALRCLSPKVIAKVPAPVFSDATGKQLKADKISLEWNLTWSGVTGADAFYFASHKADLSKSERCAVMLLYLCNKAIEDGVVPVEMQVWILDAYAGLDLDATAAAKKFRENSKPKAGGAIRKKIAALLKTTPDMKNPQLWECVIARPPKGWSVVIPRGSAPWLDGPIGTKSTGRRRFDNVCGEERKKIKGKIFTG